MKITGLYVNTMSMHTLLFLCLTIFGIEHCLGNAPSEQNSSGIMVTAKNFFERENEIIRQLRQAEQIASYTYQTNLTENNRQIMTNASLKSIAYSKDLAQRILNAGYDKLNDESIQRQAKILSDFGYSLLSDEDYKQLDDALNTMQEHYATATVCAYKNDTDCGLTFQPFIEDRFLNSLDAAELEHYWTQWQNNAGTPMRDTFKAYVNLTKRAVRLNNYTSLADYWLNFYEDPEFESNLDAAYNAILPLYKELHAYLRYCVRKHFGDNALSKDGNIPKHLLSIFVKNLDVYQPFPDKSQMNISFELRRTFELGDEFFKSLNMRALPVSFWNLSVFARLPNVDMNCHPSAWDLYQDSDVRILMCAKSSMHYWSVIHHELGHIQYFLQYEHQPFAFRDGPNPGFHEAVGDAIAMSATSQRHLERFGLLPGGKFDEEWRINLLLKAAFDKLFLLPIMYSMDKWRFAIFRDEIDEPIWNCAFWKIFSKYAGVEPTILRTDRDFDPPAIFHISYNVDVLRYFTAQIFQYQFHKALCIKAGQYQPKNPELTLDNCDIYGNKEAGEALSKFLSLGNSKHWKEALRELTGETTMDPTALLEYFEPLHLWLQRENKRLNVSLGWNITDKILPNCVIPVT